MKTPPEIKMNARRISLPLIVAVATIAAAGNSHAEDPANIAADKLAIIELCNRYAHAMDHGDPDAWIATWAPEGKCATPWDGEQDLKEMAAKARKDWAKPQLHRHVISNHIISLTGNTATHRCYASLVRVGERKDEPGFIVEYEDKLRKVDGEWKFTFRRITVQK